LLADPATLLVAMFTKGGRILEQIELRHFRKDLADEIDILGGEQRVASNK
jgi:hypothetical protein